MEFEITGIKKLKEAFENLKNNGLSLSFTYDSFTADVDKITNEDIYLSNGSIFKFEKMLNEWDGIFYFTIYSDSHNAMLNFELSEEDKKNLEDKESPEMAAQSEFDALTTPDEQELNEIKKIVKKRIFSILKEYDNYHYPIGADADINAPWNQMDEPDHLVSNKDVVTLLWSNFLDKIALFKEKATGDIYVFNFTDINKEEIGKFGNVPQIEDGDEDGKYSYPDYDNWEINDEALENYANEYWNTFTRGSGINDYESGRYEIVKVDNEIIQDLTNIFGAEIIESLK